MDFYLNDKSFILEESPVIREIFLKYPTIKEGYERAQQVVDQSVFKSHVQLYLRVSGNQVSFGLKSKEGYRTKNRLKAYSDLHLALLVRVAAISLARCPFPEVDKAMDELGQRMSVAVKRATDKFIRHSVHGIEPRSFKQYTKEEHEKHLDSNLETDA